MFACRQKNKPNAKFNSHNQLDSQNIKIHSLTDNPFKGLRNMALSVTPEQLRLNLPSNKTVVYGIVMDWNTGGVICTIVAFQTGDASMYLSSGQAYIGGGQHLNIHEQAISFVKNAQDYLKNTAFVDSMPLPDQEFARFYFLTNRGTYSIQESVSNLKGKSDQFIELMAQGQKLISEYREEIDKN